MTRLPDIKGFHIIHRHDEGDPCNAYCIHQANAWTTLRIKARQSAWELTILGLALVGILALVLEGRLAR